MHVSATCSAKANEQTMMTKYENYENSEKRENFHENIEIEKIVMFVMFAWYFRYFVQHSLPTVENIFDRLQFPSQMDFWAGSRTSKCYIFHRLTCNYLFADHREQISALLIGWMVINHVVCAFSTILRDFWNVVKVLVNLVLIW